MENTKCLPIEKLIKKNTKNCCVLILHSMIKQLKWMNWSCVNTGPQKNVGMLSEKAEWFLQYDAIHVKI